MSKTEDQVIINAQDLEHIKSLALTFFKDSTPASIGERNWENTADRLRTLAYLEGVLGHLRSRGLISFVTVFDKRK